MFVEKTFLWAIAVQISAAVTALPEKWGPRVRFEDKVRVKL